ncbi:MAG: hypothetical protein WC464_09065 [Bdellovibrionales bacterium]
MPKARDTIVDQFLEEAVNTRSQSGDLIGAFAFLVKEKHRFAEFSPEQFDSLLMKIYKKHLDHGRVPLYFSDKDGEEGDAVLRLAYQTVLPNQVLFNFFVCGAHLSLSFDGDNFMDNPALAYPVTPDYPSARAIIAEFEALKKRLNRKDDAAPWIEACVEKFGKKTFSTWIDGQIKGIWESIYRNHPSVVYTGKDPVRAAASAKFKGPYRFHDDVPGYH